MVCYCTLTDILSNVGISDSYAHGLQTYYLTCHTHSMVDFMCVSEKY